MASVCGRYRALVTPTATVPSVPADLPIEGATLKINGKPVDPVWDWCLIYPFNMLGHLPAASVPGGFTSSGVPTGLQTVGSPYDEAGVPRIAPKRAHVGTAVSSVENRSRAPDIPICMLRGGAQQCRDPQLVPLLRGFD